MQPWGVLNTDLSFFWQRERYFHLSLKDNEAIWNRLQFGTEVSLESLCLVILLHLLQFVKIFPSEQLKVYQASSRQSDSCIRVWCEIGEVRSIKYSLYVNFNSNASINVGDVRVKSRRGCNFTFVTLNVVMMFLVFGQHSCSHRFTSCTISSTCWYDSRVMNMKCERDVSTSWEWDSKTFLQNGPFTSEVCFSRKISKPSGLQNANSDPCCLSPARVCSGPGPIFKPMDTAEKVLISSSQIPETQN